MKKIVISAIITLYHLVGLLVTPPACEFTYCKGVLSVLGVLLNFPVGMFFYLIAKVSFGFLQTQNIPQSTPFILRASLSLLSIFIVYLFLFSLIQLAYEEIRAFLKKQNNQ